MFGQEKDKIRGVPKGHLGVGPRPRKNLKYKPEEKFSKTNAFPKFNTAASLRYQNCEPRHRKLIQH